MVPVSMWEVQTAARIVALAEVTNKMLSMLRGLLKKGYCLKMSLRRLKGEQASGKRSLAILRLGMSYSEEVLERKE